MKISKLILIFAIILLSVDLQGQPKKLVWQWPSIQDLKMTQYSDEPNAPAVVLEKHADVYFDDWREEMRLFYNFRERIKILNPEGKKFAEIKVPYIGYDYFEDFVQTKGFVYRLNKGNVRRKRLKKKYITYKKLDDYHYVMQMNFPDVRPGDIVEIRYTLATFNFMQPRRFYFQENIPVRRAELDANIPFFMKYYFDVYRFDAMDVKTEENSFASITWSARYTDPIPSGGLYRGYDYRVNPSFNFHSYYYRLVMNNVPSFFMEKYLDNPLNYYYHADMMLQQLQRDIGYSNQFSIFLWEKFTNRMYQTTVLGSRPTTKMQAQMMPYPAGFFIFDATSWYRLAKDLIKDPAFGKELKKFAGVMPIINQLRNKNKDTLELAKALFRWVRDYIKWNGKYDFLVSRHLNKVLYTREGNSADKNMLLVYMLRRAGIQSYPVIIRTVDKGHLVTDLAAFYQFNNVLASAVINNRMILFDATGKHPWFVLPQNDMNQVGFLVNKDSSYFVQIVHPIKPQKIYSLTGSINDQQQLTGDMTYALTGLYTLDSTLRQPAMNGQVVSLVPGKIEADSSIMKKHYSFVADSVVLANDTAFIIRPFIMFNDFHNIFDSYSRALPVYLGHRWAWAYQITINLPQRLKKLNYAPIKKSISGVKLVLTTQIKKRQVIITLYFNADRYYFDTKEFESLYNLFDFFTTLRNAKIIVNKA